MNLSFLVTFTLHHLLFSLNYISSETHYYGDAPFLNYYQTICNYSRAMHILVENYQIENSQIHGKRTFHRKYSKIKCANPNILLLNSNVAVSQLDSIISSRTRAIPFPSQQVIELIFDYSSITRLFPDQLTRILQTLIRLYSHCRQCLPFILLFKYDFSKLHHWATSMFTRMPNAHFRGILVSSVTTSKLHSLHFEAVLDGCRQLPGIFVPQTRQDFTRLKVPFENCNLNGSILNIAINKVCTLYLFKNILSSCLSICSLFPSVMLSVHQPQDNCL